MASSAQSRVDERSGPVRDLAVGALLAWVFVGLNTGWLLGCHVARIVFSFSD